jgi:hypothetical protein
MGDHLPPPIAFHIHAQKPVLDIVVFSLLLGFEVVAAAHHSRGSKDLDLDFVPFY